MPKMPKKIKIEKPKKTNPAPAKKKQKQGDLNQRVYNGIKDKAFQEWGKSIPKGKL